MIAVLFAALFAGSVSEPSAEEVFAAFEKKLKGAQSLSGRLEGLTPESFILQKPRSFRVLNSSISIYCDGKVQVNHLVKDKEYFRRDVSKGGEHGASYLLDGFFGHRTGSRAPYFVLSQKFQFLTVDGKRMAAKTLTFESFGRGDKMTFYVEPKSLTPYGHDNWFGGFKTHWRIKDFKLNVKVPPGTFEFRPGPELSERKSNRRDGTPLRS